MPEIDTMYPGKYLDKPDAKTPLLLTIANLTLENLALEGAQPKMRWCAHFKEVDKLLVLNQVNLQMGAIACKSTNTDHWIGKKIVVFVDPTVVFGGKVVGGLRIRAPKNQPETPPAQPAPATQAQPSQATDEGQIPEDDEVPF